jgi:hypothetical protein
MVESAVAMTNVRDWTTDDLINGLWNQDIYTGGRAAYELGRRRDIQTLTIILAMEILPQRPTPYYQPTFQIQLQPLTAEQRAASYAQDANQRAAPHVLLRDIIDRIRDEYTFYLALCAAAGLGKAGLPFIELIRQRMKFKDEHFIALLDVCETEAFNLFIEDIYERLYSYFWCDALLGILIREGETGIHVINLALCSGDPSRRHRVIEALQSYWHLLPYESLIHTLITCVSDPDANVATSAMKLVQRSKFSKAIPYLIPVLKRRDLEYTARHTLQAIGTTQARAAVITSLRQQRRKSS